MTRASLLPDARRPLLLDLFCGEGGAGTGYARAGFEILGVDSKPQPLYPFRFIQHDALTFLMEALYLELPGLARIAAIHASPPCQARTTMSNRWRGTGGKADSHTNLIPPTRELLERIGVPYVIENVPGARRDLVEPVTLTGEMFGLRVHRPRLFEANWPILVPPKPPPGRDSIGVYGRQHDGRLLWRRRDGSEQRAASSLEEAREAMDMPWASWRGCAEAVPPSYTELIGLQLLPLVVSRAAA